VNCSNVLDCKFVRTNYLITSDLGKFITDRKQVHHKIRDGKLGVVVEAHWEGNLSFKPKCGQKVTLEKVLVCENLIICFQ